MSSRIVYPDSIPGIPCFICDQPWMVSSDSLYFFTHPSFLFARRAKKALATRAPNKASPQQID